MENMNFHYGEFHSLKDNTMTLPEKQITAFIGRSGCGKSTLLKSLNGINNLVEGGQQHRLCVGLFLLTIIIQGIIINIVLEHECLIWSYKEDE